MNILPWLLDWPPRRASIGVFLFVTLFSVGTLLLFGGVTDEITNENTTIESTDISVKLNDETSFPDGDSGSVQTCLGSGTPGDRISVLGDVTLSVASTHKQEGQLSLAVSLAHTEETTTEPITRTGDVTKDIFWILDDDETLSVGDTAELEVRIRSGDSIIATNTQRLPVENDSRTYEC